MVPSAWTQSMGAPVAGTRLPLQLYTASSALRQVLGLAFGQGGEGMACVFAEGKVLAVSRQCPTYTIQRPCCSCTSPCPGGALASPLPTYALAELRYPRCPRTRLPPSGALVRVTPLPVAQACLCL